MLKIWNVFENADPKYSQSSQTKVFSGAILPKENIRFLYKILNPTCIELAIVYMSVTFELTQHH